MVKQLLKQFNGSGELKGYKFTQIKVSSRGFLYEVSEEGSKPHYEIFKRKLVPVCIDFEKRIYSEIDKKETYPRNNDFGVWAWTTTSLENALERYELL